MTHINPILMDILSNDKEMPDNPQITLSFNEILIKATFHNDYELVKKLIGMDEFDRSIVDDIGIFSKPFPLYYITLCHKKTMWTDFNEETMPFVERQRTDIEKLLRLWQKRFGINTDQRIDYKLYEDYFYCTKDSDTIEDILWHPAQEYLDNGCREMDLKLYVSIEKFHFEEVNTLLENGADPNARLSTIADPDSSDYWCCIDRILDECSYLCSCQVFPLIEDGHRPWYLNYALTEDNIGDLVGWAAHEDMWRILEPYVKDEEEEDEELSL